MSFEIAAFCLSRGLCNRTVEDDRTRPCSSCSRAGPEDAFMKHSNNMLGQILKSRRAGGGAPTGGLGSGGPTARDTDVWRLGQAGAGRLQ